MTPLEKAKDVERSTSTATTVSIRLSLLQDLIQEIERLQADREGRRSRPFDPPPINRKEDKP